MKTKQRPYGAAQVQAAVTEAARKRFAAEGPSVTLRDIATDAKVNLGLLHRHFGSKAALLGAVLTDVIHRAQPTEPFPGLGEAVEAMIQRLSREDRESQEYVRIVAWMLLAGQNPRDYQTEFVIPQLVKLAGPKHRGLLLLALASTFGWRIFGPHLSAIAGYNSPAAALDDLSAALRAALACEDPHPQPSHDGKLSGVSRTHTQTRPPQ
jgi:TetR/AcrR family transcriptional regulator, repressor for neighboring sulfatase